MNTHGNSPADRSDAVVFAEAQASRRRANGSGTVRVHVDDGLVTLTGMVERPAQRAEAARVVHPVIGSRQLIDCIVVLPKHHADDVDAPGEGP